MIIDNKFFIDLFICLYNHIFKYVRSRLMAALSHLDQKYLLDLPLILPRSSYNHSLY